MKNKDLVKILIGMNPDAEVFCMEAKTGEWQIVEDAEQEYSNAITLGCVECTED